MGTMRPSGVAASASVFSAAIGTAILVATAGACTAGPAAAPTELSIGGEAIFRAVSWSDGSLRTTAIAAVDGSARLAIEDSSAEFRVVLASGLDLTTDDFTVVAVDADDSVDGRATWAAFELAGREVAEGFRVRVRYVAGPDYDTVRKHLVITLPAGRDDRVMEIGVDELRVADGVRELPVLPREITTERQADPQGRYRGGLGLGQPLYLEDRFFAAVEYPAAANTLESGRDISLRHFPGRHASILPGGELEARAVVWGLSRNDVDAAEFAGAEVEGARHAFRRYLRDRLRPPRRQRHFIDAFHLRGRANVGVGINGFPTPDEITAMITEEPALAALLRTEANAVAYAEQTSAFADSHGIELDSFVIDGGWQDPRTVFDVDPYFLPRGFAPIYEAAELPLGLWNSLAGFRLDLPFLERAHGYQICPPVDVVFDLSQPEYLAAIEAAMGRHGREHGIAYWKQDFNFLVCALETPQHPVDDPQTLEANTDALIEIIAMEREINPDVFIAQTTLIWPSPFWLDYVDALPTIVADYGYDQSIAAFRPRDWHSTFVDAAQHLRLIEDGSEFPTSRAMTHGIIRDQYVHVGGDNESLESWANGVVAHLAPGMVLQELYVDPALLAADHASFLSGALAFADQRQDLLFRGGEMIGGDPATGATYGFSHDDGIRQLVFARNPTSEEQSLWVPLHVVERVTGQGLLALQHYPFVTARAVIEETRGEQRGFNVELAAFEVAVVEFGPGTMLPSWQELGEVYGVVPTEAGMEVRHLTDAPPDSVAPASAPIVAPAVDRVDLEVSAATDTFLHLIFSGDQAASAEIRVDGNSAEPAVNRGPCGPVGCPLIHIPGFVAYRLPLSPGQRVVTWTVDGDAHVHAIWIEAATHMASSEVAGAATEVRSPLPTPGFDVRRDWRRLYWEADYRPVDPLLPTETLAGDLILETVELSAPVTAAIDVGDKAGVVRIPVRIDPDADSVTVTGSAATVNDRATGGVLTLEDVNAVGTLVLHLGDYRGTYDAATGAISLPMRLGVEATAFALSVEVDVVATTGRASAGEGRGEAEAFGQVLATDHSLRLAAAAILPEEVPLLGGSPFALTLSGTMAVAP